MHTYTTMSEDRSVVLERLLNVLTDLLTMSFCPPPY